jgi:hypothetical protein
MCAEMQNMMRQTPLPQSALMSVLEMPLSFVICVMQEYIRSAMDENSSILRVSLMETGFAIDAKNSKKI